MVYFKRWSFQLFACLLSLATLLCLTESQSKSVKKAEQRNRVRRDIVTIEGKPVEKNRKGPTNSKTSDDSAIISKNHIDNRGRKSKRGHADDVKKLKRKRRCFLGSPYDCPPEFEDTMLDWKTPWGWSPGPLYPEYGPHFHRAAWGRQWRGPDALTGYDPHGWGCHRPGPCRNPWECCCCCGSDEGEESNDMQQLSDPPSSPPSSPPAADAHKTAQPQILRPFMGKQAPVGGLQGKVNENTKEERGSRRFDVGSMSVPDSEVDPSPYTEPNQASIGNWKSPDQASPDKVAGSLFLWKWNDKGLQG